MQYWVYNDVMEYEIVSKDNKTYIALFFNGDATHETPFYLVEINIVKDSDFVFLQDGGYIKT